MLYLAGYFSLHIMIAKHEKYQSHGFCSEFISSKTRKQLHKNSTIAEEY